MRSKEIRTILYVSFLYFLIIFFFGFLFGIFRSLFLVPITGKFLAVLLEIPFMLALSWMVSSWILKKFAVQSSYLEYLIIGGVAFVFLFCSEYYFAVKIFGLRREDYFMNLISPPGLLGLSAQVLFGLIPFLQKFTLNKNYNKG